MPSMTLICNECLHNTGSTLDDYIIHYRIVHPGIPIAQGIKRLAYTDDDIAMTATVKDLTGAQFIFMFMNDKTVSIVDYPGGNIIFHENIADVVETDPAMAMTILEALLQAKPHDPPKDGEADTFTILSHEVYWRTHGCDLNWPHDGTCKCRCGDTILLSDKAYGRDAETVQYFTTSEMPNPGRK